MKNQEKNLGGSLPLTDASRHQWIENLITELEDAGADYDAAEITAPDFSIRRKRLEKAREDIRQALLVPAPVQDEDTEIAWEYDYHPIHGSLSIDDFMANLQRRGSAGWELCVVLYQNAAVYKRPIKAPKARSAAEGRQESSSLKGGPT